MSTQAKSVLVLNGSNLNLLGSREPAMVGGQTLAAVENICRRMHAASLDFSPVDRPDLGIEMPDIAIEFDNGPATRTS